MKCAIGLGKLNMAEYICLVKGEDEREMLYNELENNSVKNTIVYTVKEAKGLEFSKVAVFDSGMTDNEKYVAYTRALSKLVVVRSRLSDGLRTGPLLVKANFFVYNSNNCCAMDFGDKIFGL